MMTAVIERVQITEVEVTVDTSSHKWGIQWSRWQELTGNCSHIQSAIVVEKRDTILISAQKVMNTTHVITMGEQINNACKRDTEKLKKRTSKKVCRST